MNNSFKRISFIPPVLKLPTCAATSCLRFRFGRQAAGRQRVFFYLATCAVSGADLPTNQHGALLIVPRSGERYVTDEFGVIRMYVNVWGHVNSPASYLVYDGIDLATLLSVTGGPLSAAPISKV
ncbi:MAG: hypothetical protein HQ562_10745 [Candidatus Marinimicrobia bacterium]|nr:hypothetical protein [Candidatus Neomarinimicrobiota bacterium]